MLVVAVGWWRRRKLQLEVVVLRLMISYFESFASRWICVMMVFEVIDGFVCYLRCCGRQRHSFGPFPVPRGWRLLVLGYEELSLC